MEARRWYIVLSLSVLTVVFLFGLMVNWCVVKYEFQVIGENFDL